MEQQQLEQKAILVGVNLNHQEDFEYSMEELANLAEACDIEVVGTLAQNLLKINTSHYIGTGKLTEVRALLEAHEGNLVISTMSCPLHKSAIWRRTWIAK
ncbi:hypothetical protein HMSSN036_86810 [Paenibacillus macerans]|nr:hypothetical protein HMSSN036_86810 [Paenibacillus macerans]